MPDEIHIALVRHTNKEVNMATNILKKITVGVLTIITAVCLALGFSVIPDRALADGEYTSMTVTDVSGGLQDNLNRYLVWLDGSAPFESDKAPDPIVVSVNGEDKTLELYNDKKSKAVALLVPYAVAPRDGRTEITIRQGTKICNYVVAEEITAILNRGTVKKKVALTDISFSLQRDMLGDVTSCIQETADQHRYLIRIQTDLDGLTDTMWNGNVCILDEGTENEKEININYLGGMTGKPENDGYDGTAILAIIDYEDIVAGATVSSEIGKHSVTIKQGSELGGGYSVKKDFTFYIGNEYIAEDERDIPKLPAGVFKANKGWENKTIDFETQKIEDYIAGSSVVTESQRGKGFGRKRSFKKRRFRGILQIA